MAPPTGHVTGADEEPLSLGGATAPAVAAAATEQEGSSATYRPSHRRMLRNIDGWGGLPSRDKLGAVVVPTIHSFDEGLPGVRLAAELAAEQDSALIVLCSGKARAVEFPSTIRRALGDALIVADLPRAGRLALPDLRCPRHPLSTLWRRNDVGVKRNLGLCAAVLTGRKYVLFVDDDVSTYEDGPTLDAKGLGNALDAMAGDPALRVVGWTMEDFPDNSVLGHARRLARKPQQIFISGGALLVRVDTAVPFFPDIYNEDWLFLIAAAQASPEYRDCLGWAGRVRQRPYYPYSGARTMSQEAGDILGEGVMNLLEDDGPSFWGEGMTPSYWRRAMVSRAALIKELLAILGTLDEGRRARTAMEIALRAHRQIKPEALSRYVADWKADLRTWRRHLDYLGESPLGPGQTIAKALANLGLDVSTAAAQVNAAATSRAKSAKLYGSRPVNTRTTFVVCAATPRRSCR